VGRGAAVTKVHLPNHRHLPPAGGGRLARHHAGADNVDDDALGLAAVADVRKGMRGPLAAYILLPHDGVVDPVGSGDGARHHARDGGVDDDAVSGSLGASGNGQGWAVALPSLRSTSQTTGTCLPLGVVASPATRPAPVASMTMLLAWLPLPTSGS
jgi:hypothetical protein